MANQQVMKSGRYAYVGRKLKRDFRQAWITRISAGCKMNGMNYSTFMHRPEGDIIENTQDALRRRDHDAAAFTALCEKGEFLPLITINTPSKRRVAVISGS